MKILVAIIALSFIPSFCFAKPLIEVDCWSGEKEIFHKMVEDVLPGDGYILVQDKVHTTAIMSDCVVVYINPKKKK